MSAQLHVGIDVSDNSLTVCILQVDNSVEEFETTNDKKGFKEILRHIGKYKLPAKVCLEATSTYHLLLCKALCLHPEISLACTDPRSASDFRKWHKKRGKTDRLDACGLAHYARTDNLHPWNPPRESVGNLRDFGRRASQIRKDITATRNRMHAARRGGACRELLSEYKRAIDSLLQQQLRIRKLMQKIVCEDDELRQGFELLVTITGIGTVSALTIMAELACLPLGLSKEQWVAMAGMDPEAKDSGKQTPARHISRRGNARLRHALFLPALVAIRHCPEVKAYYEHLCERGKKKMCAVFAVMRKMLLAIWGMFNTQTEWDPSKFSNRRALTSK